MSCQWFCISMTTRKGATDWTYWPYVAWILLIICHLFQHMTCHVRHGEKGITRCVKCSFNFLMCSKYCLCWPFCETNVCGLLPSPSLQLHRRAWMPINLPANPSPSHPIFTNFFLVIFNCLSISQVIASSIISYQVKLDHARHVIPCHV